MEKDVINKYNEGILHGITQKINKKAWKNDKMNIQYRMIEKKMI